MEVVIIKKNYHNLEYLFNPLQELNKLAYVKIL
jgi:hypothetical protein